MSTEAPGYGSFNTKSFILVQIQNLGFFPVQEVLFRADIWALTPRGIPLVSITDYSVQQVPSHTCS